MNRTHSNESVTEKYLLKRFNGLLPFNKKVATNIGEKTATIHRPKIVKKIRVAGFTSDAKMDLGSVTDNATFKEQ